MSHTTSIDSIVISDEKALENAVMELKERHGINCELLTNTKARAYYNDQSGMDTNADFVLKLNESRYDVGFYRKEDGTLEARYDAWAGEVQKQLGVSVEEGTEIGQSQLGKFYQEYAIAAATREAMSQGYMVDRFQKEDGEVQLTVQGY